MWSVTATQDNYFFFGSFLEDLDPTSLIDVYKCPITAAIE
jgi:hypothetical protein